MTPVRLAVIVVGAMGGRHAELIRAHPQCQLVGVCDTDPSQAAIGEQLKVPFYQDPEEMLERARMRSADGDLNLVGEVEERIDTGPDEARALLTEALGPDALRRRLQERP